MQIYADKYFSDPDEIIEIFSPDDVKKALDRVEALQKDGYWLLGYMRYDLMNRSPEGMPLVYFEAWRKQPRNLREADFSRENADATQKNGGSGMPPGIFLRPLISREEYERKIEFIKEKILDGITYEVNYTYPSLLETNLSDDELYEYLLPKQKTPYNAFIRNRHETVMSFSPELFFKISGRNILTKPMKGTVRRGDTPEEDARHREFLATDTKNRAENIMIVDLLRNDLGIVAKDGTVKADRLFEVEEHPTLFQMTSEISAELRDDVTLYDVIKAIYPCGSITGAPKVSTMRVIAEAEPYSRDVYCGAIAFIHGDEAVFSVPIRILQKRHDEKCFRYFAGGAITYDSTAGDEWNETITKAGFLQTDFSLIETGTGDRDLHLKRLRKSADELGFKWNAGLDDFEFPEGIVTRIELFRDGHYAVTTRNIPAPALKPKVVIKGRVDSRNPFLYHKTTVRSPYPKEFFEEIRVNERNEITEGTYTNVAVRIGTEMFTPPPACGLLNGVMRQKLLAEGKLKERILHPEDLMKADAVFCMNSVRGIFEVEIC